MALLWCDGFEHYGLDETKMLDGVYAQVDSNGCLLSTTLASTGTTSMYFNGHDGVTEINGLRKVLPTAIDKIGLAGRFYFPDLPENNNSACIFNLNTASPSRWQLSVVVDANGCFRFYTGGTTFPYSDGTLVAQTNPLINAASWNHIEVQAYIDDAAGWVRVAVNGVHRFQATSLDTKYNTDKIVSVTNHHRLSSGDDDFYMDDYYIYDFTGTAAVETDWCPTVDGSGIATNYLGEYDIVYLPVNGDTAEADFLKSTGTVGYSLIDETTPDDTDYVYSTTAGDLSEFDLTDLDPKYTYIRGVQLLGRLSKTDSGAAQTQFGMHSSSSTSDATARPITTIPTYWWDFMNVDPSSSARWTRASLNAAKIRYTRSV
jgi:hypothetical protein